MGPGDNEGIRTANGQCSAMLQKVGADQDRTGDLLLAKQALSQLSYSPTNESRLKTSSIVSRRRESALALEGSTYFFPGGKK